MRSFQPLNSVDRGFTLSRLAANNICKGTVLGAFDFEFISSFNMIRKYFIWKGDLGGRMPSQALNEISFFFEDEEICP